MVSRSNRSFSLAAIVAASMVFCLQARANDRALKCPVLEWIDGKSIGINGDGVKGMVHIRHETRKMQHGHKDDAGVLVGSYEFDGSLHTIHELARVETAIEREFHDKKVAIDVAYMNVEKFELDWEASRRELRKEEERELQREEEKTRTSHRVRADQKEDQETLAFEINRARKCVKVLFEEKARAVYDQLIERHIISELRDEYKKAIAELEKEKMACLARLQPALRQAKDDFKEINEPYLASINGTKSMMLVLIEESCKRRGRDMNPPSFLLTWGKVAEGKEMESFEENINSFKELDLFCTDLTNFLGDVIYSCPKACAQAGLRLQK